MSTKSGSGLSDEIVFPEFGENIEEFTSKLVGNLETEDLKPKKERENEKIHILIETSFLSKGEIISRTKEEDIRTSFERKGTKFSLGLMLASAGVLFLIGFLLDISYLLFGSILPICLGQMFVSRKFKELGNKIRRALQKTVENFPELEESLDKLREQRRQEKVEEAETTFACPECDKEFLAPEVVSLHLKREHDIEWRELTEEDFEEGKVKEEVLAKLEEY